MINSKEENLGAGRGSWTPKVLSTGGFWDRSTKAERHAKRMIYNSLPNSTYLVLWGKNASYTGPHITLTSRLLGPILWQFHCEESALLMIDMREPYMACAPVTAVKGGRHPLDPSYLSAYGGQEASTFSFANLGWRRLPLLKRPSAECELNGVERTTRQFALAEALRTDRHSTVWTLSDSAWNALLSTDRTD